MEEESKNWFEETHQRLKEEGAFDKCLAFYYESKNDFLLIGYWNDD